jgi:hypothetical protein
MKRFFFLKLFVFALLLFGCKKTAVNPIDSDLEFQFRLLDQNGRVTNTFKQGENFRFSFLIINKTQKGWGLKQESLNFNDEFFRVYKDFGDKKTVGRPLEKPFFADKIPLIPITDTLRLEIDWIPQANVFYGRLNIYNFNNKLLPIGTYKTQFTNIFEFYSDGSGSQTYKTNPMAFNINFEVK